ncbi:hypothetical protein CKM354_000546600 [Cercospora kikuchii]|uniref:Uncharacterized protein n=1 Tax=Cercospora kikuchii TaxID=84275 RepID=A0A9P3CG88_9PEZI|nr:uncharacterized protein CKM354_000546600 [Cercospora kikuchii]GIZ42188.1 hypothetical protein CKM354_000546600 [Cercospora kikuchii]
MIARTFTVASLAVAAYAQSSTTADASATESTPATTSGPSAADAETTITALFGSLTSGFAGSVISANGCDTTLALACTDSAIALCEEIPDLTATVTIGPTAYEFVYATSIYGGKGTIAQSCDLDGPSGSFTAATCTASVYASVGGQETATSTVSTITDTAEFTYAQIPITAGASNLPSAGATCDAAESSDSAAAPTGMVELYKILVPVGAAVVAGAGAML